MKQKHAGARFNFHTWFDLFTLLFFQKILKPLYKDKQNKTEEEYKLNLKERTG